MAPRGGRGGGGRRGGAPKPGFTRIGGMDIAYDPDIAPEKSGRPQPSKTFPDFPGGARPPAPRPPTATERREIALLRQIRASIRRSPLYTTFSMDSGPGTTAAYSSRFGPGAVSPRIPDGRGSDSSSALKRAYGASTQTATSSASLASVDAFNVMPHYSDRYDQKQRKMPRLDQQRVRVPLEFFPQELHSTVDPRLAVAKRTGAGAGAVEARSGSAYGTVARRGHQQSRGGSGSGGKIDAREIEAAEADEREAANAAATGGRDRTQLRKNKAVAEEGEEIDDVEGDDDGGQDPDQDDDEEEEVDDDFEDDEEELAGDYNAEGYFDDGGDDAGDDGDDLADGGGGGDYD